MVPGKGSHIPRAMGLLWTIILSLYRDLVPWGPSQRAPYRYIPPVRRLVVTNFRRGKFRDCGAESTTKITKIGTPRKLPAMYTVSEDGMTPRLEWLPSHSILRRKWLPQDEMTPMSQNMHVWLWVWQSQKFHMTSPSSCIKKRCVFLKAFTAVACPKVWSYRSRSCSYQQALTNYWCRACGEVTVVWLHLTTACAFGACCKIMVIMLAP